MKTLLIALGLSLAATGALAANTSQTVTRTANLFTLSNGCAYQAYGFSDEGIWTVAYATPNMRGKCPTLIRARQSAELARPGYLVGVYR